MTTVILPILKEDSFLEETIKSIPEEFNIVPVWSRLPERFIDSFLLNEKIPYKNNIFTTLKSRVDLINKAIHNTDGNVLIVPQGTTLPNYKFLSPLFSFDISFTNPVYLESLEDLNQYNSNVINSIQEGVPDKNSCLFIKREVVSEIGYLDSWLKHGYELQEFSFRARIKGIKSYSTGCSTYSKNSFQDNNYEAFGNQMLHLKYSIPLEYSIDQAFEVIKSKHTWINKMYIGEINA